MKQFSVLVVICFLSCWGQVCLGQVTDTNVTASRTSDFRIDWKYTAGEYLIFDCERMHYACVNAYGSEQCKEKRKLAISQKKVDYPCAPLQKLKDKKSCVEKNYQVMHANLLKRFCHAPYE